MKCNEPVAQIRGRAETTRVLLDAGADIEAKNSLECTALQCAVLGGHYSTVRQLLDMGAAIENMDDKSDSTPLLLASSRGHYTIVRLLLQRGATIDRQDESGNNALDLALNNNHREVAQALLESENWMSIMSPMDVLPVGRHNLARDTPLRKLIRKYPELAEKVFDKCIRSDGENPRNPHFFYEYDFTLLDDTYLMPSKDGTSS
ncbi:ankyrin repeat protein [Dictyocaulus viviparus]|uniref:Ankyrin repeat protein n=1 Tax=Dictyocaulus viviparus TaxID=29172 RepID=A0A0D8XG61_DICVI|nr:ankyrin repeat protein [Dictyocaulus viviparus]